MSVELTSGQMPILALRGLTVFPDQTVHFDVGRPKSIKALETAMKGSQILFLVPQKDIVEDDPRLPGLYPIGTVVKVKQVLKNQGENLRVLVTGLCRGRIVELDEEEDYLSGMVEAVAEPAVADTPRNQALCRDANILYGMYCELLEHPAQTVILRMMASKDVGFLADSIGQNSGIDYADKCKLLCQLNPVRRMENAMRLLHREMEMLQLQADIQAKTHAVMDKHQKDYYLREQMHIIRKELGEGDEESEFEELRTKVQALQLPEESEKKVLKDVDRLRKQPFGSAEASVLRNYLDVVLDLPWNVKTKEKVDVRGTIGGFLNAL
jgi:ATP-dependent Lon protease